MPHGFDEMTSAPADDDGVSLNSLESPEFLLTGKFLKMIERFGVMQKPRLKPLYPV
jgi:hypothetical protein